MSRLDESHYPGCPVRRGADPDMCRCDDEEGRASRPAGAPRPDADARPPWRVQQISMSKLWTAAGVTRRADRLVLTGVLLDRPTPESSRELTVGDADQILQQLRGLQAASRLQAWAAETLAQQAGLVVEHVTSVGVTEHDDGTVSLSRVDGTIIGPRSIARPEAVEARRLADEREAGERRG